MSGPKWTQDQDDMLRRLRENGYSCAMISDELWKQFEVKYSRNAVIGRAHRLGLTDKNSPRVNQRRREVQQERAKRKPKLTIIRNGPSSRLFMSSENVAALRLRCVEIEPRNLSLVELEPNDCRYPYGEGTITFCGHPNAEGSSYCFSHHSLVWVRPSAPKARAWRNVA